MMPGIQAILLAIQLLLIHVSVATCSQQQLKVLTLNTWMSGEMVENGVAKLLRHVKHIDADIVALQV